MKPARIIAYVSFILFMCHWAAGAQDMDSQISQLTEELASKVVEHANKKITVLDFTDLQGNSSELGRYIAEQITVDLVMKTRQFSVLDRSNLKSILAEHKLTTTGLVHLENAKKLGRFAGVDALVLGKIVPRGQRIAVTAEIISTETAEIIGGAKTEFKADETTQQLLSKPATESGSAADGQSPPKKQVKITKSFGDLQVELAPLQIVNGNEYLLTLNLKNQNPKRSIWVALDTDIQLYHRLKVSLVDSAGHEFTSDGTGVIGIELGAYLENGYLGPGVYGATQIEPGDSISATVKFKSHDQTSATVGQCRLQLDFLLSRNFKHGHGTALFKNLITQIEAE